MEKSKVIKWFKYFGMLLLKAFILAIPACIVGHYLGVWAGIWVIVFFFAGKISGFFEGYFKKSFEVVENIMKLLEANKDAIKEGKVVTFVSDDTTGELSVKITESEVKAKKSKKTVQEG